MSIYKRGRPHKYYPFSGEGQKPPALPGQYRIRNIAGDITYIGETNNLARRMPEHLRNGKLAPGSGGHSFEYQVADGRSTSVTRRLCERAAIKKHDPSLNRSRGGEGRPAGRHKS